MANYIPLTDRFWNGPKADWMDSVGNMFSEMKKKKTREELNKQYLDALNDPKVDAQMVSDEQGNARLVTGKKSEKVDPELERMKMLDALLGSGDKQASDVVDPNAHQAGAFGPNLMAEALLGERPTSSIKEPLKASSVENSGTTNPLSSKMDKLKVTAPEGFEINPNFITGGSKEMYVRKPADKEKAMTVDDAVSKSGKMRAYMDKLQKVAPEGYEVNPNAVIGGSKEVYIRKQKSDEFPVLTDGAVPDGVVPSKYKVNPKTGKPEPVEFEKKKDRPITDDQAKAAGFVMRTEEAEKIFRDLDGYISDQGIGKYWQNMAPNPLKNAQQQQYEQAQRNFVNAVLRRESGAAIMPSEFDNAREQYFPQPGDKADVIAQKAANRQTAIESLRKSAGPALASMPGDADAFAALSGVSSPSQGKAYKEGDQVSVNGKTYTVKIDENGRPYYEE